MKPDWNTCLKIGVTAFLLYLAITYWPAFASMAGALFVASLPLLIGCVIAYIINILMHFYESHYFTASNDSKIIKSRRPVCMIASFLTLAVIVFLLIWLVVPELVKSVELLVSQIPEAINDLLIWLDKTGILTEDLLAPLSTVDWKAKLEQIISVLASGVGSVMDTTINIVSSVASGTVTIVLAVIFSIYLLLGKEKLRNQADRILNKCINKDIYAKIKYLLCVLDDCFHKYIVGQCTEAVILGILCTVGMLVLGIPYATMTGTVIAFTALIPVAGAYIGASVGAFMILTVSPMKAVVFLIFLVILQQVEGNVIYPRVVGSSMGLPAIWVLTAVTIGGGMMGIMGMFVGVPVAAAIYRLLREYVNQDVTSNTDLTE